MIIDAFPFFNEVDLLVSRLEYLYDTVDYFSIVEANMTFAGNPKPFSYVDNISRFQKYSDKILYYPLYMDRDDFDFTNEQEGWKVERVQGNHLSNACKLFNDDDLFLLSDVDEIPSISGIHDARSYITDHDPIVGLKQHLFIANLSNYFGAGNFSLATLVKTAKSMQIEEIKHHRDIVESVPDGGFHLSYFFSPELIKHKMLNFSHQEFNNPEYTDIERIQQRIDNKVDLYDRPVRKDVEYPIIEQRFLDIFGRLVN